MNKIHILSDNLVNQIAAGEVVERPSSVVKELLENSLDAGSTRITIEIEDGGKKLIKITDNGNGIEKDDLPLAFERHATSKLLEKEDLFNISTMGFRGEALASIGSVSQMKIASEIKDKDGFIILNEGGSITEVENFGMANGTQVTVRNLFYNTPARLKFMKTDQTEFNYIIKYLTEVALVNPNIHFKLIHNGKLISEYFIADNALERMHQVFGKTIANELLPIVYLGEGVSVSGFVGKPGVARSNRSSQYLFVNNRPVNSPIVSRAIQDAFHSLLPHGKFPLFVIKLVVPYEKVDVNVHPRKLEVRFLYQREIFQIVSAAVKKVLESTVLSPQFSGDARSYWNTEKIFKTSESNIENNKVQKNQSFQSKNFNQDKTSIPQALKFTEAMLNYKTSDLNQLASNSLLKPLVQIVNSYILALGEEGLVIIDQHAAHERIMYNKFLESAKNKNENANVETQKLLIPAQFELSHAEVEILNQNLDTLNSIGFEIENFGGNSFIINTIPTSLKNVDIKKIMLEVVDDLKNGDPKKVKDPLHKTICYMSCRGAIKFGQKLSLEEMQALVEQMDVQDQKYTCPHGRPTMINISFDELEKRFGRK